LDRHPSPFYFLPKVRCWQCRINYDIADARRSDCVSKGDTTCRLI
jgi:hypothetical protein